MQAADLMLFEALWIDVDIFRFSCLSCSDCLNYYVLQGELPGKGLVLQLSRWPIGEPPQHILGCDLNPFQILVSSDSILVIVQSVPKLSFLFTFFHFSRHFWCHF